MRLDYFFFAIDNLRHRKLRSLLTMIGIFIGIAAVVSLISLGQGLEKAIIGQFAAVGGDRLIIQNANTGFGPPGSLDIKSLTEHDKDIIEKTKGIDLAVGRLLRATQVEFEDEAKFQFLVSWPESEEESDFILESFSFSASQGRLLKPGDKFKVVMGNQFASKEIYSKKITVGDKVKINGNEFEVVGILDKTGNPQFDTVVIVMEDAMKEVLKIGDEWDAIASKVSKGEDPSNVADSIAKNLRKDRGLKKGQEDFEIQTPQQLVETFNAILFVVQAIVVGIAFISLIVGGIGIMNTMYTAVLERTKEIGIMKAVGAKNQDIFSIFFIESGLLGMIGGAIGVLLGFVLGKFVENIGRNVLGTELLVPSFTPVLIVGALLFAFVVGSVSGILPALQASKLNPIDALRFK